MENQIERFKELNQSFSKKGEIFKKKKPINEKDVSKDFKRIKELANGSKTASKKNLNEFNQGSFTPGSYESNKGETVNSIFSDPTRSGKQYIGAIGNSVALKESEGLELSVKRTLESGAPIDGISFYDEVNWNLNNLNFRARSPQDIKMVLLKMIK